MQILWCLLWFYNFGYIGYTRTRTRNCGYPKLRVLFFRGCYRVVLFITQISQNPNYLTRIIRVTRTPRVNPKSRTQALLGSRSVVKPQLGQPWMGSPRTGYHDPFEKISSWQKNQVLQPYPRRVWYTPPWRFYPNDLEAQGLHPTGALARTLWRNDSDEIEKHPPGGSIRIT